jgi:predicted GNAT family acetyltransferase
MELVFLCVQATHTGQGLARRLTEETIAVAHRIGMPFIKTNPSTPGTFNCNNSFPEK